MSEKRIAVFAGTFDRITLAYRNQQAGEVVWPETQSVLEHRGLDGMLEYPIARAYADARVHRIYAGTTEIMKELVARSL